VGATPSHLTRMLAQGALRVDSSGRHRICRSLHSGDSCLRLARAADGWRLLSVGLYEVPREDVASGIALAAHSVGVLELAGVCGGSVGSEM
jgi:hypothetical protein